MADALEKVLKKSMVTLGHFVESVIGKAKETRAQVSARHGIKPLLSVESQLSPPRLNEIINAAVQKILNPAIPELKGVSALEIGEGQPLFIARFLALQAKSAVGVLIGGDGAVSQGDASRGFIVRAEASKLPFANAKFSYFLARMATNSQGDMVKAIREFSRILLPAGLGVIADFHPFGLFAKRGAVCARPAQSAIGRIEDYYRICRQEGMRIVDVREVIIDEGMRQFFKEDEIQAYRNLKGTPLLIFLFVYKPKGA